MRIVLIIVLIVINLISFAMYGIDKRRAIKDRYRISEKALLAIAFFGGRLGALAGMTFFHHKTKHLKFRILLPLFLILHIIIAGWLLSKGII